MRQVGWEGAGITRAGLRRWARWTVCLTAMWIPLAAAEIVGRVLDPTGNAVVAAKVELIQSSSTMRRVGETNGSGEFLFADLSQGRYRVYVQAGGFAAYLSDPLTLNEALHHDVTLRLGGVNQTLVVSGSRAAELQDESPAKVDAVSRDQIRDTGYERAGDVLSEVPGVVVRSGSTATVGGEQIQGIDSRQVLVLQDGLPIPGARGIKSGLVNLNRQDVGKLERIEVAKGAASALYGSDAIGGVINMITREPSAPFDVNVSFSGGSLGAADGRIDAGGRWKRLSVFTDLEGHHLDSYRLIPSTTTTVGPETERYDGLGKVRYWLNDRAAAGFTASAYHNYQLGVTQAGTVSTLGTSNDSVQAYTVNLDLVPTSTTTVQLRGYASRYDENSQSSTIGSTASPYGFANLNERYHRLDATVSQQLGRSQTLQGGYEWVQDAYRGANRLVGDNAGQQITTNDLWFQDRIQPFRRLTLTLGGRSQTHSLYGTHLVPKVGLVLRANDHWVIRGSFGQGFRAPDLGQLYYRFANPSSFYQVIGNPNLRPETSTSYSTGVVFRAGRYRAGVTLFRHNLRDLIDSYMIGTPSTPQQLFALLSQYSIPTSFDPLLNRMTFVYLNLNRAYTQGFELDGDVALTRSFRVQGAYTYLNAEDRATGLLLPQRHRHQGYVKTEYHNTRLGLLTNVRGTFFSKWPLNPASGTYAYGYQIWDLYASQRLPHQFQLFAAIDNLANSRDQKLGLASPTYDRPDYGRTFRAGLRFSLRAGE